MTSFTHSLLGKIGLYGLLFFFVNIGYTQNHPCAAISLPYSMENPATIDISGINNSSVPLPICTDNIEADIWFETEVPPGGFINFATFAGSLTDVSMAIYQGECTDLVELGCMLDNACNGSDMPALHYYGLEPGSPVYIRVWPEDATSGSFEIQVNSAPTDDLNLITVGSAFINNEGCTQLTNTSNNQVGCAWYPDQFDFSEPFEFHVSLHLGTMDSNGADGMCLIFQTNDDGTSSCGTSGQNIAATGIDNSFIVEFDTWNNGGGAADIPEDHSAVSINGNLTNPINGPVALPNIEDGQYHDVRLTWDPTNNQYEVFFDNVSILQGTFDIIANCFDGATFAYAGFSAATGGSSNNQIACAPPIEIEETGTMVITEMSICEGEEIMLGGASQSTAGLYIDTYSIGDCDSIVYTHLSILERSFSSIEETICAGDEVTIGSSSFSTAGTHEATLTNALGCDSVVTLTLHLIGPEIHIAPIDEFDCHNSTITLDASQSTGSPNITFEWTSADGCIVGEPNQSVIEVDCPGTYQLAIGDANLGCINTATYVVTSSLFSGFDFEVVHPNCDREYGYITIPALEGGVPPFQYSINGGDDFYDYNIFQLLPPAPYEIVVQDANDCALAIDTAVVLLPEGIISLEERGFMLQGESYQITAFTNLPEERIDTIIWTPSETLSCYDCLNPVATPAVTTNYFITIIDTDGCVSEAMITVHVDERPLIFVPNIFSPNGDGNNDELTIFSNHPNVVQINSFEVYDRWGSLVFADKDFQPNDIAHSWNGNNLSDKPFASNVFVWQAEINLLDGRNVLYSGDVIIMR